MDIETMHKIRKGTCTCKRLFLWPEFHAENCKYQIEGMDYITRTEQKHKDQEADNVAA
jgi:hypothetical protein